MKLKYTKLRVGQKYFLIDYENDVVVEGMFYNNDLYGKIMSFDFKHTITTNEEGDEDYKVIYLDLRDGVLKENVGNREDDAWVENPIFSTLEEAEAKKKKYILSSLKAVRKLILKELEENTNQIKKLKGE